MLLLLLLLLLLLMVPRFEYILLLVIICNSFFYFRIIWQMDTRFLPWTVKMTVSWMKRWRMGEPQRWNITGRSTLEIRRMYPSRLIQIEYRQISLKQASLGSRNVPATGKCALFFDRNYLPWWFLSKNVPGTETGAAWIPGNVPRWGGGGDYINH